jgi:adenosylcobinamide-phosphate synthase
MAGVPPSASTPPAAGVAAGLSLGFVLDAAIGDPRRGHPVAAFGIAAARFERWTWRDSRGAGVAYTGVCVGAPVLAGVWLSRAAGSRPVLRTGLVAAATWSVIGGTTLGREARAIAAALGAGDLELARRRLPALVGRDPSSLSAGEVARAVVESVAENTSDAVVAPLLWGAVAGLPGLLGYRAVNTLDAMVGHRSVRYERFGWASARLDDVANWVPARLTGWLAVALAPAVGGSRTDACTALLRDGHRHPSPNSGRCEAAFAGALGVTLGGRNDYAGRVEDRPLLGSGGGVGVADVERAVRLSTLVSRTTGLLVVALVLLRTSRSRRS